MGWFAVAYMTLICLGELYNKQRRIQTIANIDFTLLRIYMTDFQKVLLPKKNAKI